ncbi:MAG: S1 RNA-binding domain-containing protein, partial [Planctomycetota bacterium]|nr:S1 RNA-binding domain-containing protein [Planctomycetota bacterium]
MPADIAEALARRLSISRERVLQVSSLLDAGLHPIFIAHYRKAATGGLDAIAVQRLAAARRELLELEALRDKARSQAAGAMPKELALAVQEGAERDVLEDFLRLFKPRRRTAALVARQRGLAPLADYIWASSADGPDLAAKAVEFVSPEKEVRAPDEALAGASHILAERIAEDPLVRRAVRKIVWEKGILKSKQAREGVKASPEFRGYFKFEESLNRLPPHRVLAVNRGERGKVLKVRIEVPADALKEAVLKVVAPTDGPDSGFYDYERKAWVLRPPVAAHRFRDVLEAAAADAVARLVLPAIEREVRRELTDRAEEHAIDVFVANLRSLLMTKPTRDKRVLAIQPGYRTGCKLAALEEDGKLLGENIIYPFEPQKKWDEGKTTLLLEVQRHQAQIIAIGNGTGCREVEQLVSDAIEQGGLDVQYAIVSEAGAAVYADSDLGKQEFPNLDAAIRATVSIGRRLQDPLAELVKIDPRAIGVGLYQHDLVQPRLRDALDAVMVECVGAVGADANTASPAMLRYIPGLRAEHVQPLVARRTQSPLASREDLRTLPGWDEKTFATATGFLRISGTNPLDATRIHPESYPAAEKLLARFGFTVQDLAGPESAQTVRKSLTGVSLEPLAQELGIALADLVELVGAIQRPGFDPRSQHHGPVFRKRMRRIEDLSPGMWVKGTVRNVVDFGAFVDIGLKEDGLVHISQFSKRYVRNPLKFLHVGDVVDVRIVSIDPAKHRIALTLISEEPKEGEAKPAAAGAEGEAARRPPRAARRGPPHGPRPAAATRPGKGAAPEASQGAAAPAGHGTAAGRARAAAQSGDGQAAARGPRRVEPGRPRPAGADRRSPAGASSGRPPQRRGPGESSPGEGGGRGKFRRGRPLERTGPPRIIISAGRKEDDKRGADEQGRPKIRWA